MYPDAGGVRPTFHDMAQRLADLGYAVLLPDPYYRLGEIAPFDMNTVFTDEAERNRLMKLVGSVTKANATIDTAAELDWLAEQPEVSSAKVGTTGYCMGGGMALNAAGRFPDRVGAAASFHGGQIASTAPDSPHLLAGEMQAKVYVAGAEKDGSFDDEQFERLSTGADRGRRRPHARDVPGAPRLRRPRQPDLRRGRGDPPLGGARGALRLGAGAGLISRRAAPGRW